jgi:hypothetical protein
MGSCCSHHEPVEVVIENDSKKQIESWNHRREDVIKNLDALFALYISLNTRNEQIRLIEQNLEVFQEFFNLPPVHENIYEQIEHMFQVGLIKYVKPKK